jgi:uncharacterized membrane protein YfcA
MFVPNAHEFMVVSFVFLAAGGVKGVLGMGLPTVAMGLLGMMMPVAEGAALLVLPSLVTNLWQMARGGHLRALARRLWPMLAGVCVGVWLGRGWMSAPAGIAIVWLGLCLVVYALAGLAGLRLPQPKPQHEAGVSGAVGTLTGLLTAATGVFVLPAVPYLHALGLKKDEMAQALGLSFTVSTLVLAVALASSRHFNSGSATQSLLMLLPALLGMWLGQRLRDELSQESFRAWFMWGMLALGAWLVWQGR